MKNKLKVLLIAVLIMNLSSVALGGKLLITSRLQQGAQTMNIDQLKRVIQSYEAVVKNPNIPANVKEPIQSRLEEARNNLERALNEGIASLRGVLAIPDNGLKEEEKKVIEGKIEAWEQEIKNLKSTSSDSTPQVAPSVNENRRGAAQPPQPMPQPRQNLETPPVTETAESATPLSALPVSTQNQNIDVKDCTKLKDNPKTYSLYEKYVCQTVNKIITRKTVGDREKFDNGPEIVIPPNPKATITNADDFAIALALIGMRDKPTYLVEAEESRTDKQVGAGPQANGSTSLVVKGSAPRFFGLAVESGALTQAIDGNTITFRGNPIGILQALANKGYLQSSKDSDNNGFLRVLKPFSFSLSYDTSRNNQTDTGSGTMANVFTGDRQQLSQVTARYEFINHRDPRGKQYRQVWEEFLKNDAGKLTKVVSDFIVSLLRDKALMEWRKQTQEVLRQTKAEEVEQVIKSRFAQLPINNLLPVTIETLKALEENFEGYLTERKKLLDKIAKGTIVAFEYTNTRNVESPNLSNFRLIAEKGPGGNVDATFNASLTIFNKIPMGMTSRIRDFQFAGQIDYKTGNLLGSGDLIFFAAGRYERLLENAMAANGMTVMDTKGDIGIFQTGVKIPIKGTGFSIPISFSAATRTELIKEKEIRGNIGFTFDLDRLFSNVKP